MHLTRRRFMALCELGAIGRDESLRKNLNFFFIFVFMLASHQTVASLQVKRYFISFWNGVDLRYRLLKGPRIRISIAGIIISRVSSPVFSN